jgi:hypothetical protein
MPEVLKNFEETLKSSCGCDCGKDIEYKNAVAIQRNATAIVNIIKTLQMMQDEIDKLKPEYNDPRV